MLVELVLECAVEVLYLHVAGVECAHEVLQVRFGLGVGEHLFDPAVVVVLLVCVLRGECFLLFHEVFSFSYPLTLGWARVRA
ncbi:hypothetical protein CEP81_03505 [Kocuria rhizophila]|nr:hypothetical protein CEP81_03505 [Kocuria rhizophila]